MTSLKHIFVSAWLLLHAAGAFAYSSKDSVYLYKLLKSAEDYNDAGNTDTAITISNQALALANASGFKRGIASTHTVLGNLAYVQGKYDAMKQHDSIAITLARQLRDTAIIMTSYELEGLYEMDNGDPEKAEHYFKEALRLGYEKQQSSDAARMYSNLGLLYDDDKEKATQYFLKSIYLYEKAVDDWGLATACNNYATLLNSIDKKQESFDYAKRSMQLREKLNDNQGLIYSYSNIAQMYMDRDSIDKADYYVQQSIKRAEQAGIEKTIIDAYIRTGLLYAKKGQHAEGLKWEMKAIGLLEKGTNKARLAYRYIGAAMGNGRIGDSAKASDFFQRSIAISEDLGDKQNLRDAYLQRAIFYKDRKNFYNAYEDFKKYIKYRDEVVNKETTERIAELETQYETQKKEDKILQLDNEKRIQQLEIEKQQATIKGNLLEAAEAQHNIDLLTQARQLQELKLSKQEAELNRQKALAQVTEQQRQLAIQEKSLKEKELQNQSLIRNIILVAFLLSGALAYALFNRYKLKKKLEQKNVLLRERSRISSELHDEVGSTLSAINILSHSARLKIDSDTNKSAGMLEKINENSQRMMDVVSDIVWSINPDNDTLHNLAIRMKEFAAEILEARNIGFSFTAGEDIANLQLSPQQRKDVYLAFKESINNIAKYAQATQVNVRLQYAGGILQMSIKDYGKGFDAGIISSGNGLKNLKARAEAHGGECSITSQPGNGSSVQFNIPIAS